MNPAALPHSVVTVGAALQRAWQELELTSSTPRLDAEVLVMHVCRLDRGKLITRSQAELTGDQRQRLNELSARRRQGEPVAYLTGWREFWSMEQRRSQPAITVNACQ